MHFPIPVTLPLISLLLGLLKLNEVQDFSWDRTS